MKISKDLSNNTDTESLALAFPNNETIVENSGLGIARITRQIFHMFTEFLKVQK